MSYRTKNSAVSLCVSSNCPRPNRPLLKEKGIKKEIMSNGRNERRNQSGELRKKCEELTKGSKMQYRKEGRKEGETEEQK